MVLQTTHTNVTHSPTTMPNLKSQSLFQIWFGIGAPLFFFGIFVFLLPKHFVLAAILFGAYVWRVYDSFHKTCSRCQFYGSWRCGLPGKIVSLVMPKNTAAISRKTIRQHALVDWIFLLVVAALYVWAFGRMGLLAWIWPATAYFLVYKPKRFHGLLWRL